MNLKTINNRVNVLEEQAAVHRTISETPDFNTEWAALIEHASPQELRDVITSLETKPISADEADIQNLANSSGIPADELAEVMNQALTLTMEVLHYEKTKGAEDIE